MTYNEFKNKYNGKVVDYDGAYGGQCWDLAQKYFTECLNLSSSILAGCGLVSNMLKSPKRELLLKYFDEVENTKMCTGDVCIWEYGHIAIFDNWDGSNCWYFSQNPNPSKIMTINKSGLHAFRLKSKEKYLNISPEADYRTVYSRANLIPKYAKAKLNPKKYGGLSYKILSEYPNEVVKIKTEMFGECYISAKSKYYGSISDKPKYKNGNY